MREVERVAALDAEKLAVNSRVVAIVAADDLIVSNAQRGLAPVRTVRANSADVLHFPRPGLIAVHPTGQRPHRTNVDAHAALVALQVIENVWNDLRSRASIVD